MAIGLQNFPPKIRNSLMPLICEPQIAISEEGNAIGRSGNEVVEANQSIS